MRQPMRLGTARRTKFQPQTASGISATRIERPKTWKLRSAITAPGKPSQFCGGFCRRIAEARIVDRPRGERDEENRNEPEENRADQADRDADLQDRSGRFAGGFEKRLRRHGFRALTRALGRTSRHAMGAWLISG